jgi:hypothetical protein
MALINHKIIMVIFGSTILTMAHQIWPNRQKVVVAGIPALAFYQIFLLYFWRND